MFLLKAENTENFLDKVPLKVVKEFIESDGKIILQMPKFKNAGLGEWLVPKNKSAHIKFHLDILGTQVWDMINDSVTVEGICNKIKKMGEQEGSTIDQLEERVVKFLSDLYKSGLITFR
jgi:hypothetical protein